MMVISRICAKELISFLSGNRWWQNCLMLKNCSLESCNTWSTWNNRMKYFVSWDWRYCFDEVLYSREYDGIYCLDSMGIWGQITTREFELSENSFLSLSSVPLLFFQYTPSNPRLHMGAEVELVTKTTTTTHIASSKIATESIETFNWYSRMILILWRGWYLKLKKYGIYAMQMEPWIFEHC